MFPLRTMASSGLREGLHLACPVRSVRSLGESYLTWLKLVRSGCGVDGRPIGYGAPRAVLAAGGTLAEVGELLGHAMSRVSMVYSSFDGPSLAVLARPWPTEVDDA
jgi:hypothetical protein